VLVHLVLPLHPLVILQVLISIDCVFSDLLTIFVGMYEIFITIQYFNIVIDDKLTNVYSVCRLKPVILHMFYDCIQQSHLYVFKFWFILLREFLLSFCLFSSFRPSSKSLTGISNPLPITYHPSFLKVNCNSTEVSNSSPSENFSILIVLVVLSVTNIRNKIETTKLLSTFFKKTLSVTIRVCVRAGYYILYTGILIECRRRFTPAPQQETNTYNADIVSAAVAQTDQIAGAALLLSPP